MIWYLYPVLPFLWLLLLLLVSILLFTKIKHKAIVGVVTFFLGAYTVFITYLIIIAMITLE